MWRREGTGEFKRLVYIGPQKSNEWNKARKFRITGSRACCVLPPSCGKQFKTITETADIVCGRATEDVNDAMLHGIEMEDSVREWYEKDKKVTVEEVGFGFLESQPHIGVSPDGLVGKRGMLEIKCPKRMYGPLWQRFKNRNKAIEWTEAPFSRPNHLWSSHYNQMQMQMAVFQREWCDYLVVSTPQKLAYLERVKFNPAYWAELFPALRHFVRKYLGDCICYIPVLDKVNSVAVEPKDKNGVRKVVNLPTGGKEKGDLLTIT